MELQMSNKIRLSEKEKMRSMKLENVELKRKLREIVYSRYYQRRAGYIDIERSKGKEEREENIRGEEEVNIVSNNIEEYQAGSGSSLSSGSESIVSMDMLNISEEEERREDGKEIQTEISIPADVTSPLILAEIMGIQFEHQSSTTADIPQLNIWNPPLRKVEQDTLHSEQQITILQLLNDIQQINTHQIATHLELQEVTTDRDKLQHHLHIQDQELIQLLQEKDHLSQRMHYVKQELGTTKDYLKDLAEDNLRLGLSKRKLKFRLGSQSINIEEENNSISDASVETVSVSAKSSAGSSNTSNHDESFEEINEDYIFQKPEINKKIDNLPGNILYKRVYIDTYIYF